MPPDSRQRTRRHGTQAVIAGLQQGGKRLDGWPANGGQRRLRRNDHAVVLVTQQRDQRLHHSRTASRAERPGGCCPDASVRARSRLKKRLDRPPITDLAEGSGGGRGHLRFSVLKHDPHERPDRGGIPRLPKKADELKPVGTGLT